MDLPETTAGNTEGAAGCSLNQALVTLEFLVDLPLQLTAGRSGDFDLRNVLPVLGVNAEFNDLFAGEWEVFDAHDFVAAFFVRASETGTVNVQLHAHAVAETVCGVIARCGLNLDAALDAGHAVERLFKNVGLQFALTRKLDVTKLGTAGAANSSRLPEVSDAVGRRLHDFVGLSSAE